jgi:hypothetical protein
MSRGSFVIPTEDVSASLDMTTIKTERAPNFSIAYGLFCPQF